LLILLLLLCLFSISYGSTEDLPKLLEELAKSPEAPTWNLGGGGPSGATFPCKEDLVASPTVPTSVHVLRPADINVIAALGDSITAGYGAEAKTLLDTTEYRGIAWSIGVQKPITDVVTMAKILESYTRKVPLYGGSIGNGKETTANSRLNVAVSGAIGADMPGQAVNLVQKMKGDANVDFNNHWKMITIWIGGNDLCRICNGDQRHQPAYYVQALEDALTVFYDQLPRVFVNMVQMLDVTQLYDVHDPPCDTLHQQTCACATSTDPAVRQQVRDALYQYQTGVQNMVNQPKWNGRQDFAVVIQPFFMNTTLPMLPDGVTPDRSYFAPDCFHFALKSHEGTATALWNNIVTPVGKKSTKWTLGDAIQCPTDSLPYLWTNRNSPQL